MANRNGVDCERNSTTPSGSATTDNGSIQDYLLEAYVMASQPARADSLFTSECVRDAQLLNFAAHSPHRIRTRPRAVGHKNYIPRVPRM